MRVHYHHPEARPVFRSFDVEERDTEIAWVNEIEEDLKKARDKALDYSKRARCFDISQALSIAVGLIEDAMGSAEIKVLEEEEYEGVLCR